MADDPDPEKLRQIAEHRGLKLLKSRRRKPGTGDYGKFGLTDATGKPLLGIGSDGLTASPQDIETWLRTGALGTWRESASTTPDRPAPERTASKRQAQPPETAAPVKPKPGTRPDTPRPKPAPIPKPAPKPVPAPTPRLAIRPAKVSDADAIARLLNQLHGIAIDSAAVRHNLAAAKKAGGGLFVAELGKPIGCCGWTVVHTIHRGPIGRITAIFVAEDHRRHGVARKLLAAVEQTLTQAGCTLVEAISDIQLNNAHNFFRALAFAQTSYRFTRKLVD